MLVKTVTTLTVKIQPSTVYKRVKILLVNKWKNLFILLLYYCCFVLAVVIPCVTKLGYDLEHDDAVT